MAVREVKQVRAVKGARMLVPFTLLLLSAAGPTRGAPYDPPRERIHFAENEIGRCLKCHGMANFAVQDSADGPVRDLHVDTIAFASSAHGGLSCRSCHPDVAEFPHVFPAGRQRVSCGAGCHATDKQGRPYDHAKQAREFGSSAHGRGKAATNPDSPTCATCHGAGKAHAVLPVKRQMTVTEKMSLCAGCHDDRAMMRRNEVDPLAVASYRRSFHYKAIHFGARGTAVCQDCHAVHRVLAKDDTTSSIAAANLPKTCGQDKCHRGATMNFAMSGANHLTLRIHREPLLLFEERFFLLLTGGTMVALVGGIILDMQRRFGWVLLLAALGRRLRAASARSAVVARAALVVTRRLLID